MKIGFIGLGIMGTPMVSNIIKKLDNQVFVFDLNENALQEVVELGAVACKSTPELCDKVDVMISMVPKNEHVKAVYGSILDKDLTGKIFIDMSTISPEVSREVAASVSTKGGVLLDCPVVKSQPAAVSGQLGIYVGGDHAAFEKIEFILECMGSNIIHLGENGSGLVMKIAHNMLVGQIQNGVNEMLLLAKKASGIDPITFAKAISYGGGQNFYLDVKHEAINNHNFATAFSIENMHKDVHLAKELSSELDLDLLGVNTVCNRYDEAMEIGIGKEDFCATIKVIDEEYRG